MIRPLRWEGDLCGVWASTVKYNMVGQRSEMQTSTLHLTPSMVPMHHTRLKACWKPRHSSSFTRSTRLIWIEEFHTYSQRHLGIPEAIRGVHSWMNFQHWSQKQRVIRVLLFLNVVIVFHSDKKKRPALSFTLFSSVWIVGSRKGEDFAWGATDVTKRERMKKKKKKQDSTDVIYHWKPLAVLNVPLCVFRSAQCGRKSIDILQSPHK